MFRFTETKKISRFLIPGAAVALLLTLGLSVSAQEGRAVVVADPDETVWVSGEKYAERAYLGVRLEEETELEEGGARVTSVVDDSPADEAGIREGDVIVEFDGRTVRGPVALTRAIHSKKPGTSVAVTVMRDGRRETFDVEMGEWAKSFGKSWSVIDPEAFVQFGEQMEGVGERIGSLFNCEDDDCKGSVPFGIGECEGDDCSFSWNFFSGRPVLGVQLVEVTPELREHLGARGGAGVLISKVISGSAAETAGIAVGDLIVDVAGDAISNTRDLRRALHDKRGETFTVELIRGGRSLTLDVTIPEPEKDRPTGPRARLMRFGDDSVVIAPRLRVVAPSAPTALRAPRLMVVPSPPSPPSRPASPSPPRAPRPVRPSVEVRHVPTAEVLTSV